MIVFLNDEGYPVKAKMYYTYNGKDVAVDLSKNKDILNYKDLKNTIYSLGFNIREDRYNGIDCYVIRTGNNEDYRDIWIDKSNFITIRSVNECKNDFYCEEIYTFIENNVKNDDISTKIIEENEYKNYTKIYNNINTSEEMKNIYKLY